MEKIFQPASMKLKDLVKAVRACKTASEERDVIAKQSAVIRTQFKEENQEYRHRNVAKLLYIHMLGYPAQWGQIECVKLVASPRFADKRLGYLGTMLLLDESAEVLTLVTNSLKNDMNHSNIYVNGLALATLGNIASSEMARDLCSEVEKLLGSQSAYVRKKAALCAVKIIRKVPDLLENFISRARSLLNEKNHAVLLTGVTLISEMCLIAPEMTDQYRSLVTQAIRLLKSLLVSGNSPEHDVSGISDPFLQVKLLNLLRILGRDSVQAAEQMNDVLAQVATNTDTAKNVGNAVLYETVLTIMDIPAESGLRVLAVNILGRFLSNRDNNIRYVALNTLLKTVAKDVNAVQRHRKTIVDCLADPDVSIRRRAMELTFTLVNESNVRVLVRELLTFLEKADKEFKPRITTEISLAAEQYAPNKRWHLDTILRVLRLAGNYVRDDIISNFIRLVASSPELHGYAVLKLYTALTDDISQEALVQAGVWAIGEYGDVLLRNEVVETDEEQQQVIKVTEKEVLDLIESIIRSPFVSLVSRQYCINTLVKLSTRFHQSLDRIRSLLRQFGDHVNVEIQQRATEYLNLFSNDSVRQGLLERMPPLEPKETMKAARTASSEQGGADYASQPAPAAPAAVSPAAPAAGLLDLDLMGDSTPAPQTSAPAAKPAMDDILSLFGGGAPAPVAPVAHQSSAMPASGNFLDDLLGGGAPAPAAAAAAPPPAGANIIYDKNGVRIELQSAIDAGNPQVLNCKLTFVNYTNATLTDLNFQAAVPKTLKIQLQPPASTGIAPQGNTTQLMRILNPTKEKIRLRIKLNFSMNGRPFEDLAEIDRFPQM